MPKPLLPTPMPPRPRRCADAVGVRSITAASATAEIPRYASHFRYIHNLLKNVDRANFSATHTNVAWSKTLPSSDDNAEVPAVFSHGKDPCIGTEERGSAARAVQGVARPRGSRT